jgi:hypothetical protein
MCGAAKVGQLQAKCEMLPLVSNEYSVELAKKKRGRYGGRRKWFQARQCMHILKIYIRQICCKRS